MAKGSGAGINGGRAGSGGGIQLSNKAARGRLSNSKVVSMIDANSMTSINVAAVRKQVEAAAPRYGLWGKTDIPVNKLIIKDKAGVAARIKKQGGVIDRSKPIIVDSRGYVIDGRHRALLAMQSGASTITGYVPITGK